jgi:hypothetical protein
MAVADDAPAVRWHTREDSGLRVDAELRWWHDGQPVEHPRIVEAFNRGLTVTPEGRYRLEFGGDWCFVEVEECGFGVLAIDDGRWLWLTDRTREALDPSSLEVGAGGALTCRVKGGGGRARFSRPAHLELASALRISDGRVMLDTPEGEVATGLSVDALG